MTTKNNRKEDIQHEIIRREIVLGNLKLDPYYIPPKDLPGSVAEIKRQIDQFAKELKKLKK